MSSSLAVLERPSGADGWIVLRAPETTAAPGLRLLRTPLSVVVEEVPYRRVASVKAFEDDTEF